MNDSPRPAIDFFAKYLSVWVVLCMLVGIAIAEYIPTVPALLAQLSYANISLPIAVLIWLMIYPMMMKVDFASVRSIRQNPHGLYLTWVVNWLVKPFLMYGIALAFFFGFYQALIDRETATAYLAGAVLLGAAPCTAMVFVWSHLTRGNPTYTVMQVATNDLIILIAFVPIVKFLLGVSAVEVPWETLFGSVVLFVVVPLAAGIVTRRVVSNRLGEEYFITVFIKKFDGMTTAALLVTLVLIFSLQGQIIVANPFHIFLIAVPLIVQTGVIFAITYGIAHRLTLPHTVAAPAAMIGASNFFELAVVVAIALFGAASPATLVTIVGVLVEVPVMLGLVWFANRTRHWFDRTR